jgi:SpoVK/Ycf46/Vps4 family AAA+-type ATPase
MNDNNKNKSLKTFTYGSKKNSKGGNKAKNKAKSPLTNIPLDPFRPKFNTPNFPKIGGNEVIKIIPINRSGLSQKTPGMPDINEIFKMLLDPSEKTQENEEYDEPELFKIKENKTYDTIDVTVSNLDKLIEIAKSLDNKKEYSFDVNKLKVLIDPLERLKQFVGMEKVKDNIVKQILYFLQNLDDSQDMMHTVITGPPGVGKTKLAYLLSEIYFKMGIFKCKKNKTYKSPITGEDINFKFTLARRSDLIGEYVGHTAIKTQKVIDSSLGGVLLIDEAYSLGNDEKKDSFSKECIDTLNQNLTENKGKFAVIIAGYDNELEKCFFSYNDGLRRRFPFRYEIISYNFTELSKIFTKKIESENWNLDIDNKKMLDFFKQKYKDFTSFGGDMEILLFSTKIAHSLRIFGKNPELRKKINLEDLQKGFEIFKETRKQKDEIPYGLYV